jgi:hypothetical protein
MTESNDKPNEVPDSELPPWYIAVNESQGAFPMYEHIAEQGFPTVKQLHQGIVLGSIADAMYLATGQESYAGRSWDGDTYRDDNQQGELWAAAFTPEGAVAVFYSSESERNPWPPESPPYDQAVYFQGMPETLRKAKERALSWMINFDWVMGGPNAVVTAAMWSDGQRFTANEPWRAVFWNSLWACHKQLSPLNVALIEWRYEFDLHDQDVAVLRSLYLRRICSNAALVCVEPWERDSFVRPGNIGGLECAQGALAAVGIELAIAE